VRRDDRGDDHEKAGRPPIVSAIYSVVCRLQLCVVGPNRPQLASGAEYGALEVAGPSKARRPVPPSPPPVHCKKEGVSDPTRRLQSRPRGQPGGRSRPRCHRLVMRWLQGCCAASCRFNSCSERRRSDGRVVPPKENPLASGSCGRLRTPLVPLRRHSHAVPVCVRLAGHHVFQFWSETRARQASALRADPFGLRA
jgi:hypothetical protein